MTAAALVALFGLAAAWVASLVRWVRVAQREHYLGGAVGRFAVRWWTSSFMNAAGWIAALGGTAASFVEPLWALLPAAVFALGPVGMGLRGRTSRLAWTPRVRRVAGTMVVLEVALVTLARASVPLVAVELVALPVIVDVALWVLEPLERRLSRRFVEQAAGRLRVVAPKIVAITGSYGKTTTKGYVGHLLRRTADVVVSPASFNNRLGLARSINEQVASGTQVFVAEMGTYGPGEIRDMCSWIPPTVAVITAIGPVHLERFGSLEAVAAAKAEIVDGAETLVLNVDYPSLEALADGERPRRTVIRCSTANSDVDVHVDVEGIVFVHGKAIGSVPDLDLFPGNVACAVGVALALGVTPDEADLSSLARPPHRLQMVTTDAGVVVIDDTYNSNPAGARAALAALARRGSGRRVVVTPGMIELGPRQYEENSTFAAKVAEIATDLVIVGRTNRRALLEGAARGLVSVNVMASRDEAVEWVRSMLGAGDVVVYENDLPDHYP
ncbi:MAG: UDP-N-acetylmuramoyl-tripeptide--D-alanyl-D-alanine ligase [Acidimicrobiia bacterium]